MHIAAAESFLSSPNDTASEFLVEFMVEDAVDH